MLRGDNIICGTSTTGTGTLTLAATPSGLNALDPLIAFGGMGFGTTVGVPVRYTIIEYTDNTYAKMHQKETGWGTLLLGASITACTLSRDTILFTQTALDSAPAFTFVSPTAITIGTAANTLVMLDASSVDFIGSAAGYSTGNDSRGFVPSNYCNSFGANSIALTNGNGHYVPVEIPISCFIKSATISITGAITTPATSQISFALYAVGTNGKPSKKLIDFGTNSANPLGTTGNVTLTASQGVFIPAGWYIFAVLPIWTGGTGSLKVNEGNQAMSAFNPLGTYWGGSSWSLLCEVGGPLASLSDPAPTGAYGSQANANGGTMWSWFRST